VSADSREMHAILSILIQLIDSSRSAKEKVASAASSSSCGFFDASVDLGQNWIVYWFTKWNAGAHAGAYVGNLSSSSPKIE
jgi:hypothetical protein